MDTNRSNPTRVGDLAAPVLAALWAATCAHREARGEAPPPDHLKPASTLSDLYRHHERQPQ